MKSFEEKIVGTLSGASQQNALALAAFINTSGMTVDENHSQIIHQGKTLAYIHMDGSAEMPGPWSIWPDGDFSAVSADDGFDFDESMKEIAQAHVNLCANCGQACAPGSTKTLFGKDYDGACGAIMVFTDPGDEDLVCLQKLLLMKA